MRLVRSEALRSQLDIGISAVGVLALKKDSFQGHVTRNDVHNLEKMALVHVFPMPLGTITVGEAGSYILFPIHSAGSHLLNLSCICVNMYIYICIHLNLFIPYAILRCLNELEKKN